MRIDRWLELKRTKVFCFSLAFVFTLEQAVWGADPSLLQRLQFSEVQRRQMDTAMSAAIYTIYEDLYNRAPTADELNEALEFLHRTPRLAHLMERLAQSPESRWRLRQLNPERIKTRKAEASRISQAVSLMVAQFLRNLVTARGSRLKAEGQSAQGSGLGAEGEDSSSVAHRPSPVVEQVVEQTENPAHLREAPVSGTDLSQPKSIPREFISQVPETVKQRNAEGVGIEPSQSLGTPRYRLGPRTSAMPPSARTAHFTHDQDNKKFADLSIQEIPHLNSSFFQSPIITISPNLSIQPDPTVVQSLDEVKIATIESWLKAPETLCSNCASNALAPMLEMVGRPVSRETLTAQGFLVDYLTGKLHVNGAGGERQGAGEDQTSDSKPTIRDSSLVTRDSQTSTRLSPDASHLSPRRSHLSPGTSGPSSSMTHDTSNMTQTSSPRPSPLAPFPLKVPCIYRWTQSASSPNPMV